MIWRNIFRWGQIFHFSTLWRTHLISNLHEIIEKPKTPHHQFWPNFSWVCELWVLRENFRVWGDSGSIIQRGFFLAEDVKTSSFRLVMIYYWMQDFLDSVKVIWPHDGSKTTNFLCENFCPWSSFYQRTFMFASWYLHFPMWTCSRVKCKFKDVSSSLMVTKHMFY